MVTISVSSGLKNLKRDLLQIEREHFNKIVRNSLLDAGKAAREAIIKEYDRSFPKAALRGNNRFRNAAVSIGAGTPAISYGYSALKKAVERKKEIVIFDNTSSDYMERHARGGTKRGSGGNVAIPSRTMERKRTKTRGIPKNLRPRQLLNTENNFLVNINGRETIARQRGREPVEIQYFLKPSVRIKKSFRFYEIAQRRFSAFPIYFGREFNFTMKRAIRSKYA